MARGNQRDKAREANQKKMADQVLCAVPVGSFAISVADHDAIVQKKGNSMSGTEMKAEKEKVAAKMREKQAAGQFQDSMLRGLH
jgi:hypothetical protein